MAETFESMMQQLETIVTKLDGENVSLEESITLYEQGIKLSKACQAKLEEAERKINQVQESVADNGE